MIDSKDDKIVSFSIGKLFEEQQIYRIPLYQRNFSWGRPEVKQLIRDIADFALKPKKRKYYLGILVVYNRKVDGVTQFELVDGQQRLTVLSLLMHVFGNKEVSINHETQDLELEINFAHRPKAQKTLSSISRNNVNQLDTQKTHNEIKSVYQEIPVILREELEENGCSLDQFYKYLTENVVLYRSPLPDDTELNHYFEVMNNRGEQLEKHEILKAKMLEKISSQKEIRAIINHIWEYCSDMNRYVQYSFDKDIREPLFGEEWNDPFDKDWFRNEDFEDLEKRILSYSKTTDDEDEMSIKNILSGSEPTSKQEDVDNSPDRFQSPINFQNFLLHVLRIYQNKYETITDSNKYASLDDKVLLEEFYNHFDNTDFVKQFIVLLLKVRFLLDQYVIKREYKGEGDEWSLLRLRYYYDREKDKTASYVNSFEDENENKHSLMLLAMFHVSTPTQNYKHWLTAVLNYLSNQKTVNASDYISHLKLIARKLFFDRFMISDKEKQISYEEVVFEDSQSLAVLKNKAINKSLLTYKSVKNNLVFNYLDYLIWVDQRENTRINEFEFRFRSSVEHFNPRNPREHEPLPKDHLDSFGNLCLIAHGKNSSFGNNSPLSKAYNETSKSSLDSLKLYLMMEQAKEEKTQEPQNGGWGPDQVVKHQEEMISKFESVLHSDSYKL